MANYQDEIYTLRQASDSIRTSPDKFTQEDQNILFKAYNIWKSAEKTSSFKNKDLVNSFDKFIQFVSAEDLIRIANTLEEEQNKPEQEEEEKDKKPESQESTIPTDLEAMVASYKENQTELQESSSKIQLSVADQVKRARKTWQARHQAEEIIKNRQSQAEDQGKQKEIDQIESDSFFLQNTDTKAENKLVLLSTAQYVAKQAIIAQANNLGIKLDEAQIAQATSDVAYLAITGATDLSDLRSLNIATQLTISEQGKLFPSPVVEINKLLKEQEIADIYTGTPDQIQAKLDQYNKENPDLIQRYIQTSTKNFQRRLNQTDQDIDIKIDEAKGNIHTVQQGLSKAIPNPQSFSQTPNYLEPHAQVLEQALRKIDPTLKINPEGGLARASGVIQQTGNSRQLSSQALHLYGIGVTPDKLDAIKEALNNDKQLKNLSQQEKTNLLSQLDFQLNLIKNSKKFNLPQISKIEKGISSFYSKLPSPLQKVGKIALNPTGFVNSKINQSLGKYIGNKLINKVGTEFAIKTGQYILENGLREGAKLVAKEGLKKAGLLVAGEGLTVSLATALSIPTAGASLIIGAILMVGMAVAEATIGQLKKGFDNLSVQIYGEKVKTREAILLPAIGAGTVLAGVGAVGTGIAGTFQAFATATATAAVSAASILGIAGIVVGLFLGITFLVAPILSTLVQLDSQERVVYDANPGGPITLGCANSEGIFVYQNDPSWKDVPCQNCSSSGTCDIGGSGCGSVAMTMILKSFGAPDSVTDVWHRQHGLGGYVYTTITPPFEGCSTDNNKSLGILTGKGLSVTEITPSEIKNVLDNCGLVLATGSVRWGADWYGHLLVIVGIGGGQITTLDPGRSNGDHYTHTLNTTYRIIRTWAVVP